MGFRMFIEIGTEAANLIRADERTASVAATQEWLDGTCYLWSGGSEARHLWDALAEDAPHAACVGAGEGEIVLGQETVGCLADLYRDIVRHPSLVTLIDASRVCPRWAEEALGQMPGMDKARLAAVFPRDLLPATTSVLFDMIVGFDEATRSAFGFLAAVWALDRSGMPGKAAGSW